MDRSSASEQFQGSSLGTQGIGLGAIHRNLRSRSLPGGLLGAFGIDCFRKCGELARGVHVEFPP